jgi:arsenite/tail-anchored protein-transporting ATPase
VKKLLPRLRDPDFTCVILVTLPEATPIHEAMQLERDLVRAGIEPSAWVVNQCLTTLPVTDPILQARQEQEVPFIKELLRHASRLVLEVWREIT